MVITASFEDRVKAFLKSHDLDIDMGFGWGCTENASNASMRSCRENSLKGTVGAPAVNTIVSVFEPNTYNELKYGEKGELCICSPNIMLGYFKDEDMTKQVIRVHPDGRKWLHMGDFGTIDQNGIVTVMGRMSRVIAVYLGCKISPPKIEDDLSKVRGVHSVAICQMTDMKHTGFDLPVCFVVPERSATEQEVVENIRDYCEKTMPDYSRPKHIFVRDSLPLTKAGKTDILSLEAWLMENLFQQSM